MRADSSMLSIVIPVFNEEAHIEDSFRAIRDEALRASSQLEWILVDDGSTDGTWDRLEEIARESPGVTALRLSRNFGKEAALAAGLDAATGDAVVAIDCDLQHPPSLLPVMYQIWLQGDADVVEAVRVRRHDEPLYRRLGAGLFALVMTRATGLDMVGATDFKLLDRRVVDAWRQLTETQLFYRGLIAWLGFRTCRVSFEQEPGQDRASKWSFRALARFALGAISSFTAAPLHLVTLAGGLFLLGSLLLGSWTLYQWFSGQAVTGFATVILLQLIIGSIVMLSLGVIGEYLGQIYMESKRRQRYVVSARSAQR
ncbi:MAG TPA: glycosyltransferase family 2 protein [Thermoanaerobaculia bacterium]|nr:glycosyltransferase family 2 protein [Thermoanaerobaculia bacterium]